MKCSLFQVNLALSKPAFQSSTWCGYNASLVVDGNPNTDFNGGGSCSNTNDEAGGPNWLVVDLQQPFNISYVVLTNRGDGWGELISLWTTEQININHTITEFITKNKVVSWFYLWTYLRITYILTTARCCAVPKSGYSSSYFQYTVVIYVMFVYSSNRLLVWMQYMSWKSFTSTMVTEPSFNNLKMLYNQMNKNALDAWFEVLTLFLWIDCWSWLRIFYYNNIFRLLSKDLDWINSTLVTILLIFISSQ